MGNERVKAEAIGASPPAAIVMISILTQAPSPRAKLTAATATAKKATTADRGKGKAAKKVFSLTGQKFKKREEVRIARIFTTYGPRMCIDDGRVVRNFVAQALRKEPLTVYGDGKQTRSFQYVSDLVGHL
ncbi:hypothetical protein ZWY2020_040746 [Hordeum vulgare]|nr:hypothetical protein ZWY2020_040746 [Hordeum vulgare]